MLGTLQYGVAAVSAATVSAWSDGTARPMTATMLGAAAIAVASLIIGGGAATDATTEAADVMPS